MTDSGKSSRLAKIFTFSNAGGFACEFGIHVLIGRGNGLPHLCTHAPGRNFCLGLGPHELFVSQRDHRIGFSGAAGGNVTCQHAYAE